MKTLRRFRRSLGIFMTAILAFWQIAQPLQAATVTFDANTVTSGVQDGSGIWNSTLLNFWNGSADQAWPNSSADTAVFGGGTAGTAGYIEVGSGITANGLTFNTPNAGTYTLNGGTITLAGTTPTITANANVTIYDVIAGSTLNTSGSGTITLVAANTYTGLTTIGNLSTLNIMNVLGLGTNAAGTTVSSGGTLSLSIVATTPTVVTEALTLNGTGVGGNGALVVNNSATWSGTTTAASASTINVAAGATFTTSGTETFTGAITKAGAGTWALGVTTAGTGGLVINGGAVTQSGTSVAMTSGVTVNSGGTYQVTGSGTGAIADALALTVNTGGALDWQQTGAETFATLNLNGTGIYGTGALVNSATGAATGGAMTVSSGIVLQADSTIGVGLSTNSLNLGTSVISGVSKNLTVTGAGSITSAGANSYNGTTTVSGGTLLLNGAAGAIASSSGIILNGGKLTLDNVTANANRIFDTANVTLSKGGELNLSFLASADTTETIQNLGITTGNSTVTVASTTARITKIAAASFSRANNATALIRGTALDQSAATNVSRITLTSSAGLSLVGSNTLANAGVSDATQAVTIVPYLFGDTAVAGTGKNFVTYDTTLGLRVLNATEDATLAAVSTTAAQPINAVAFNGAITAATLTVNSLLFSTTGQTLDGTSASALTVNSGAVASIVATAIVGGNFSTLTLGNNGTWNEGVLTATLGSTLTINPIVAVTGSGGLTKAGAGTVTLANTSNSYSGATTINQGILNFAGTTGLGALGAGTIINLNGGTLQWGTSTTADISARTVNINVNSTLDTNGNNVTLASAIGGSGAGGLNKAGAGTLTLSAASTYTGGTTVTAGTLSISNANQLGTLNNTVAAGITLAGGTLQITSTADLSAALVNVTGTATLDVTSGTTTLGNVIGSGAFTKTSSGTLTLAGTAGVNSSFSGNKTFNGGTTNVTGTYASNGTSVITVGNVAGNAILNIQSGASFIQDSLLVGNLASANGAVFQSGGTVLFSKSAGQTDFAIGNATSGYGYYQLSGGSLTMNEVGVSAANGALGVVDITGGTLTDGGFLTIARGTAGSTGILNVTGGTVNLLGTTGTTPKIGMNWTAGNTSVLTVSGSGAIVGPNTTTYTLDFNAAGGNSTGIVNLNGGSLQIYGLVRATASTSPLLLNFNGGTLRYAGNATTNTTNASFLANLLTSATIYSGGATIDDNGGIITIAQPLLAPTGSGVSSIALGTAGSGYIAPPVVTLSGGGGVGATAVAVVDTNPLSGTYGQITGYTITNAGTGYTSAPTVALTGGGGLGAAAGTVTTAANATTGGLIKNGDGTLILSGVNTYAGTTTINAGTLSIANTATESLTGNITNNGILLNLANTGALNLSGTISGTAPITQNASGVTTFSGASNSYSGTTTLNAGTITLDFTTNNNAKVGTSSALVGNGGTLTVTGNTSSTFTQTVNGFTAVSGITALTLTSGQTSLALGALSATGGIVNFTNSSTGNFTTTTSNTGGIIGGFALFSSNTFATNSSGNIIALATGSYTANTVTTLSGVADMSAIVDTNLATGTSIGALRFSNSSRGVNIGSGNTLTISGGGVLVASSVLGSSFLNGGTLQGSASGALNLTTFNTNGLYISSVIANNGGATALAVTAGTGGVFLTGANTYTGNTYLNAGTVQMGNAAAFGSGGSIIFKSGTLQYGPGMSTDVSSRLALASNSTGTTVTVDTNGNNVSFASPLAFNAVVNGVNSGNFVKNGAGTLTLNAASTYVGTTTVGAGGVLRLGVVSALPSTTAATFASGATLDLNGQNYNTTSLSVNGTGAWGTLGAIVNTSQIAATITNTITAAGSFTIGGLGDITVNTISGNTVTKVGTDSVTFAGTSDNPGVAAVVSGGTLNLAKSSGSVRALGGALTANAGALVRFSGSGGDQQYDGAANTITLNAGSVLDLYGGISGSATSEKVDKVSSLTGSIILNSGSSAYTFTTGNFNSGFTQAGSINKSDFSQAAINYVKGGTGTTIISGTNTYTGTTTINAGTLSLTNTAALGTLTSVVMGNAGTGVPILSLSANSTIAGLSALAGSTGVMTITTGAASTLTVNTSGTSNYYASNNAGLILAGTGALNLVKAGSGTLSLAGANTYTGTTAVNGGTLTLDFSVLTTAPTAILPTTTALTLSSGTLNLNGKSAGTNSQTVASLAIGAGASAITATQNGATSLGALFGATTRSVGGTLNFVNPTGTLATANSLRTTTGTASTILTSAAGVAYATLGGSDWAAKDSTNAWIVGLSTVGGGYTPNTASALGGTTANTDMTAGVTTTLATGGTTNSIRFNTTTGNITNTTGTLAVTSGGLLVTSSVGAGALTISGGSITGASGADLVVIQNNATTAFTISSVIADLATSGLTKSGAGTLVIGSSSANTYLGATYINAGTLRLATGSTTALPTSTIVNFTPAAAAGTILDLNGNSASIAGLNGYGIIQNGLSGTVTLTVNNSTSSIFGGTILTGTGQVALTKSNSGTLTLVGANTSTGATNITGGTLVLGNGLNVTSQDTVAARLANTSVVTFSTGTTLQFNNSAYFASQAYSTAGTFVSSSAGFGTISHSGNGTTIISAANTGFSGSTVISNGILQYAAANALGTTGGGAGTITMSGSATSGYLQYGSSVTDDLSSRLTGAFVNLDIGANAVTFASAMASTTNFLKLGTGTLTLATTAQTYSGTTTIGQGAIQLSATNLLPTATALTLGYLNLNTGASTSGQLILGSGATAVNQTVSDIISAGTGIDSVVNGSSSGNSIFTLALPTATTRTTYVTFGGSGANQNNLVLNLAGVNATTSILELDSVSTYTGGTTLTSGVLRPAVEGALGTTGNITFAGGTLQYGTGVVTDFSSRIKNSTGAMIIDTQAGNVSFASALDSSNTNGLTKLGTGTLNLTVANSYTGLTTVTAGTLIATAAGAIPGATTLSGGTLQVSAGGTGQFTSAGLDTLVSSLTGTSGTFAVDNTYGPTTISNTITGSFGVTKLGGSSLTLAGTNTYTGNTTVSGGTLNVTGTITGNQTTSTLAYGGTAGATVVNVSNNMTLFTTKGATVAGAVAVYNQTAGTVNIVADTGTGTHSVSAATGGYGYFNLTGGTFRDSTGTANGSRFTVTSTGPGSVLTASTTNTGVIYVGGTGFLDHTNAEWWLSYGLGQVTVADSGKIDHTGSNNPFAIFMDTTTTGGSYGVLNLAGANAQVLTGAQPLKFGNNATNDNGNSGFLNLAAGTLSTGANILTLLPAAPTTINNIYLNFAGGTLKATANLTGWNPASSASANVNSTIFGAINNSAVSGAPSFTGGLTVDTNGFAVTLGNPLSAATGTGVTQANLTVSGGSGYVGAPAVIFSSTGVIAGGTPAAGYALISGGQVTGIVITAPGTYTSGTIPTITLVGGFSGGTAATVTSTALNTANTSGGLTKNGAGTLTLSGMNTFTGAVVINNGSLVIGSGGAITASALSGTIGRFLITSANGTVVGDTISSLADINRTVNGTGTGTVAVTSATASQNVDLSSSGFNLPNMALGANGGTVTYTGTFTPGTSGVYNLGGGGGVLLFGQAITGTSSVNITGNAASLTGTNNFTGGFTLASTGTLQITSGNVSANFGNNVLGLVSNGGTIQWASGATTDITSGAAKITSSGSNGVSINFASGTTTVDTNGNTVTLAGAIGYGNGAIQKTTLGTLILTGATNTALPFTGGTTISSGAIQLGNATALRLSTVTNSVTNGLTFSSGVGTFTIGGLSGGSNLSLLDTGATAVTLQVGQNNANTSYNGVLSGTGASLVKVGVGVLSFVNSTSTSIPQTQTYTGATVITGGTSNTNLANSGNGAVSTSGITLGSSAVTTATAQTNLINNASVLTFGSLTATLPGGGTFTMAGPNAAAAQSQTFASTSVVSGFSSIVETSGNASNAVTLTLNAIARTAVTAGTTTNSATGGGTINFTPLTNAAAANQIVATTTSANDTTGILGAWATTGNTDYAAVNGSSQIIAYTGYTNITTSGTLFSSVTTSNARINAGATTTTTTAPNSATTDLNTLAVAAANTAASTITIGTTTSNTTGILRLGNNSGVGGILLANGAGVMTIGNAANAGILTAGNASVSELDIFNGAAVTGNGITINSTIKDNTLGPALTLVKSGSGQITLAGTNTYTGGTIIQSGRVSVNTNSSAFGSGAVTIMPGGQMFATGGTYSNNFFIAGSGINENPNYGVLRLDGASVISGNVTLIGDAVLGTSTGAGVTGGTITGNVTGGFSLFKSVGTGRIILTGANSYTGATSVTIGVLQLGGGTASTQSYSSLAAQSVYAGGYPGGTAASAGAAVYVNTTNAGDFQSFLNNRANPASTGTFAFSSAEAGQNIDFSTPGLTQASLGTGGGTAYTGTFTPSGSIYRLGGGGATLTLSNTNALTGTRSLIVGQSGTVALTGSNNFTGGTTILTGATLNFVNGALGTGNITFSTGGTLQWASVNTQDISSGRTVTIGATSTLDLGANNVTLASGVNITGGGLTKIGAGTLTLNTTPITTTVASPTITISVGPTNLNVANALPLYTTLVSSIASGAGNTITLGANQTIGSMNTTGTFAAGTGGINLAGSALTYGLNNAAGLVYDGVISGSTGSTLIKAGTATHFLRNAETFIGSAVVNNGILALDLSQNTINASGNNTLPTGTAVILGGGYLDVLGRSAAATNAQTLTGNITLNAGASTVAISQQNASNVVNLTFPAFTRITGGTVNLFTQGGGGGTGITSISGGSGSITLTQLNTNYASGGGKQSILGGYATFNSTLNATSPNTWAVTANSGASNVVAGLATFSTVANAGTLVATADNDLTGATASLSGATAVNTLRFNTATSTILDATGGLTVASGGILLTSTVAANTVAINNGTLTSGNTTDLIIHQYATGDMTIGSQITGTGISLTKSGTGRLILNNASNNYTGTTYVNAGTLQYSVSTTPGSTTGIVHAGAAVELVSGITVTGQSLNISGSGAAAGLGALTVVSGSATWAGGIVLGDIEARIGTASASTLTVSGNISDGTSSNGLSNNKLWINGGATGTPTGTIILSGTGSTYTGSTSILRGTLRLGATGGISSAAILDVHSGGSNAGTTTDQATFDLNGFNQTVAGLTRTDSTGTASVTNTNAGTTSVLTVNNTANYTFAGTVSDGSATALVGISKSGTGTLTLSGTNTFTGGTTVSAGTLVVGSTTALGGSTGTNALVTINGGTLDLFGITNVAVGTFSGTGGVVTDSSTGSGTTVFSTASNANRSFAGSINNGAAKSLAFYKDGTGTLTLSGSSNYTGVTNVFAGALNVQNNTALGTTAGGVTVYANAGLELQNNVTIGAEALTLNGAGSSGASGALRNISDTNSFGGVITLGSASRINSDAGTLTLSNNIINGSNALTLGGAGSITVSGIIGNGAGTVTKDGAGTVILSGANSYTGLTTVSAGTLNIQNSTGLGTTAAGTIVAAGAVLQVQGNISVGAETLTTPILQSVSGNNSWSGGITAQNNGALTLQSDAGKLTVTGAVNAQSADTTNQALVLAGAGNGEITQAVSNPASVTKSGAGTWTLSGANTYSSATAVNAGTLQAGVANAFSSNSAVTLANVAGTSLDLNNFNNTLKSLDGGGTTGGNVTLGTGVLTTGSNTSYGGAISGSSGSGVTKTGSGIFTSTGSITGTVALSVSGGTFLMNGSTGSGVTSTVANNATLGGSGTLGGTTTINSGGTLQAGDGTSGQLTTAALIFGSTSGDTGRIQLFNLDGGSPSILNATNITANGGANSITFYATNGGALGNGTYTLVNYSGTLNDNSAFKTVPGSISGLSGRQAYVLDFTTLNKINFIVSGDSPKWTGFDALTSAQDLVWHVPAAGAAQNWQLINATTPTATDYQANDSVLFEDSAASGNTTVNINEGDVSPTSVTISNSSKNYVFNSSGGYAITGSTGIVKNGTGTATINNSNSFTGGLTVTAGTVILNAANTFTGDIEIDGAGVLTLGAANAIGTGNALVFGAASTGQFNLNGNNATVIGLTTNATAGTPVVQNTHASSAAAFTVNLASGTNTFAGTLQDGVASAALALVKSGAGTLVLTGANSLTGGTSITGGTLQIGSGGTSGTLNGNSAISSGASLVFNRSDSSSYAGDTSGLGTLTAQGGNTLIITGTLAQTGGTTIAAGETLQIGSGGATGAFSGTGAITNNGTLNVNRTGSTTVAGAISGSGNLSTTAGTLILTGTNSYGGTTVIGSGSTLQMGNGSTTGTLGTALTITDNGTFAINRSGTLSYGTNIIGTGAFNSMMTSGGTLTLTGTNTYSNGTTVSSGTLKLGSSSAFPTATGLTVGSTGNSATFDLNNFNTTVNRLATAGTAASQTITNSATGTAILTYNSASSSTFGGSIADTSGTQKIGVSITGGGTLQLAKTNAYTGGTIVTNGTAQVGATNAFTTGSLTLGGTGTVGTLDLNGNSQSISSFAVGSGGTAASQTIGNSSTSADGTLVYTGSGFTFASTIQDVIGGGSKKTALTLSGSGTVIVTGNNTYTGTTSINSGETLQLGSAGTVGNIGNGAVSIASGAALTFNRTNTYTLGSGNLITGAGNVNLITSGSVAASVDGQFNTTGALNFGSSAGATIAGTLDLTNGSSTVGSVNVQTNNTVANIITIGSSKTLTINNGMTVGYVAGSGSATNTRLTVNGGGTLAINGSTLSIGQDISGTVNSAWTNAGILDVTDTANFTTNLTSINLGVGSNGAGNGQLKLSNTANTLLTTTLTVGDTGGNNGSATSTVTLGTGTNVIQADTINIGRGKNVSPNTGVIQFASQTPGSSGTVTITNKAGTGAANITVANVNGTGTAGGATGLLDLRGHTATVNAGTLTISQANAASSASGTTGVVSFDAGTFTVATLNMAPKTGASTGAASATLNVGGGTFTVNTAFILGSQATGGTSSASLNLTGGTFTSNVDITQGGGSTTSTILFNGTSAILDLTTHSIGTSTNTITLDTRVGTLRNLGLINTTGGVTKTTAGTLTLTGTNTFTGGVSLTGTAGQLNINSTTALGATAGVFNIGVAGSVIDNTTAADITVANNNAQTWNADFTFAGTKSLNMGTGTVALGAASRTVTVTANTLTEGGVISGDTGTVGLTKAGAGTMILTANNTYSGTTTISAGTLQIGSGGTTGTLGTNAGTISNSGTLAINRSNAVSIANIISGTGGVSQIGSGTTTLSGASDYSGATSVTAGALTLTSTAALGNTAINVGAGLAFNVQTSSGGSVNAGTTGPGSAGATLSLGSGTVFNMGDSNVGTFNLRQQDSFGATTTALTLSGSTLTFDLNSTAADLLAVGIGKASVSGTNIIGLNLLGTSLTNGTYNLITANQGLTGTFQFSSGLTAQTVLLGGTAYALVLNNSSSVESLTVTATPTLTWTGSTNGTGASSNVWNNAGSTNWAAGSSATNYVNGSAVTFTDTNAIGGAAPDGTVTVQAAGVTPSAVLFNNSSVNYSVSNASGSTGISGSGSLTKQGSAMLTLNSTNSYTGGTSIAGGTLSFASGALGTTGTVAFTGASTLQWSSGNTQDISARLKINDGVTATVDTNGNDITFAGAIQTGVSATGALTKTGSGKLTLTANNTYTGTTSINGGILNAAVADGTGTGALGNGGNITFGGGTLQYSSASAGTDYSNRIKNSTTGAVSIDTNGNNVTFAGVVDSSNTGGLTKTGNGILTLNGTSTYSGATTVSAGNLQIGSGGSYGTTTPTVTSPVIGTGSTAAGSTVTVAGTGATTTVTGVDSTNTAVTTPPALKLSAPTVSGTGTINGNVIIGTSLSSVGVLRPGDNGGTSNGQLNIGSSATSTVANLTVASGSQVQLKITSSTSIDSSFDWTVKNANVYLNGLVGGTSNSAYTTYWQTPTIGSSYDSVKVNGVINLGAGVTNQPTILVTDNSGSYSVGQIFKLLDWTGVGSSGNVAGTGTFNLGTTPGDLVLPNLGTLAPGLNWDTSAFTGYGVVVVVPEPSRVLLLFLGLAALFMRRRRLHRR